MSKLYVVIYVGCHECGVGSEVVGTYASESTAKAVAKTRSTKSGNWRDGGQSIPEVFEISTPTNKEVKEDV